MCLSSNAAERGLRGIALGRKSWLFCGSDRGGRRAAAMYSLIVTAKMNGIDPQAWLTDILARIAAKMKQKAGPGKVPAGQVLKDIRRADPPAIFGGREDPHRAGRTAGEENISELCRREGIPASMYYGWSKELLEAGKRRLAGDTARAATSGEVCVVRRPR